MRIRRTLERPVPLWLVLVGILTTAAVGTAITLAPGLLLNRPDFRVQSELGSVQTFTSVAPTSNSFRVFVRSQNGFSGVVSMAVTSSSSNLNAYIIFGGAEMTSSIVLLGTNDTLRVSVGSKLTGNYAVTVTGSSNGVSHSTTVPVVVQDFTASANPGSIAITAGQNASSAVKITGVNGLGGALYLVAGSNAPFHGPGNFCCATQLSTVAFSNSTDCSNLGFTGLSSSGYAYRCTYEVLPVGGSLVTNLTIHTATQDAGTTWTVFLFLAQDSVLSLPQTIVTVTVN